MGCTSSKPATAPEPTKMEPKTNGESVPNGSSNIGNNSAAAPRSPAQTNNSENGVGPSTTAAPGAANDSSDAHWNRLWEAHRNFMLDPADIHSTIEDLMARSTNKLIPAELTFIQRKVRKVLRRNGTQDAKKANLFGKTSNASALDQENRFLAERYHLLTNNAIQQVLPTISLPESSSVNPVTAIFLLLVYSHESRWDRVAEIAVETAKSAGFNMDVNALQPPSKCPSIPNPSPREPIELPLGVSLHSLAFMIGLALRGTRNQKLQLLFYLMLPAKVLAAFLSQHPAGGVPLWLLEVENQSIFSLASLLHYHLYGDAFTPGKHGSYHNPEKQKSPLVVNGKDAFSFLDSLLKSSDGPNGAEPNASDVKSPTTRKSSLGLMRRSSHNSMESMAMDNTEILQTEVMDRLHDEKSNFDLEDFVSDETASRQKFLSASLPDGDVHMREFVAWCELALDGNALDAIMYRLFGCGLLPNPSLELDLVRNRWKHWQETDCIAWSKQLRPDGTFDVMTSSVRKVLTLENESNGSSTGPKKVHYKAFGGVDGFDGRGGSGLGVMYCIEKLWWEAWKSYSGWSFSGENSIKPNGIRPKELSTESLLNRSNEDFVPGTYGSYELMKKGLELGKDYVLVPPGVWDVLYEIYGGGPPLPRMVVKPKKESSDGLTSYVPSIAADNASTEIDLDVMGSTDQDGRVISVPRLMHVETHPWVLHFHLCDPQQPYRRGDAGPMTIRVMVTPDQPLWRLYAEVVVRLPFSAFKVFGSNGRGRARLWKRTDPTGPKDAMSRYGPWALLCKNRFAILPSQNQKEEFDDHYDELRKNWEEFADSASIESVGLSDEDQLMVECATLNRSGQFIWPREAAAKAGQVRHLADQDTKFRQMLRGLDESGKPLENPPELVGMTVDAMDSSGRWYQVRIVQVQLVDDTEEDDDSLHSDYSGDSYRRKEGDNKELLLDFSEHGGHSEWIDVDSDRLATAGRFTLGDADEVEPKKIPNGVDKAKVQAQVKKATPEASENGNGKICTIPGFGACGLVNLGNTCYANSAIQCISYLPLLRAYILNSQYKITGDFNKDNPLGTGGKLLEEFADLLRIMWSAKIGEKSPTRFKSQLGKANMQFSGADQQDAQEFLNFMLDALHEDTNRVRKKPYVEGLEDAWVEKNSLPRVGEEAWRRFLRRNRSFMADIAMGQVLNTVTCPECGFSSRNFDPFNLLSVPFPTVADVIFKCYVVRRANVFNTPWVLNKPKKGIKVSARFPFRDPGDQDPPSDHLIIEEYIIAMSRLADCGDLREEIQQLCGIPATHLRLCRAEEVTAKDKDDNSVVRRHTQVTLLTDKEGPCSQFGRHRSNGEEGDSSASDPSLIVAFESTLRSRPLDKSTDGSDSEDDYSEKSGLSMSKRDFKEMERQVALYGNQEECRLYDTETTQVARAVSRSLWPRTEDDFKLGLRVDAIDHRQHWFPGSVVEILETNGSSEESKEQDGATTKVRIHFDNFSSKWDELYTIDHFKEGRVQPLYSHAVPRSKPTEFICHHRYMDRTKRLSNLFGQSFFVQCQNEWSTARAGAQILAQASRFLKLPSSINGPVDIDDSGDREAKIERLYDRTQAVISDLIDLLIDVDREYIQTSLGLGPDGNINPKHRGQKFRNPSFDASELSSSLIKRVNTLLHRLPFELRVCTAESPLGGTNEEVAFPFSLMRTIGNYMNSRHAVVFQWREPPSDKSAPSGKNSNYLGAPVMYTSPAISVDKESAKILEKENERKNGSSGHGSGGLQLGVCLSEFCKMQELTLDDNWRCPQCREYREGKQSLELWRLPDILTIHIKRFNCSARWREKITTKVNFPLSGLDMNEWCHENSPSIEHDSNVYDLIGVIYHYGGMTGGHYVATCKATPCGRDGREEVAHDFNGAGVGKASISEEDPDAQTGWRIGRQKSEVNFNKIAATQSAKATDESAEPLWLQFDDEMVEPIAPRHVVSEMAYVLFYRRRQLTPANIARYSTLE